MTALLDSLRTSDPFLDALEKQARQTAQRGYEYATPGEMAQAIDPTTVQTPALDIIDNALVAVDEALDSMLKRRNLFAKLRQGGMNEKQARNEAQEQVPPAGSDRMIVSMPPQEGKSERCSHYGVLWMLRRHPELRVAIVSYEERLAQEHGYKLRNDIATYDGMEGNIDLGLRLRKDSKAVGSWKLQGEKGSVYAIGIGGALTGRPVDLLIIDDPVKDYRAADSNLLSDLAWQWWQSVARARLAPGAPVIVILTRWHEADMAGRLLSKQREDEKSDLKYFDRWRVVNIPAQADYDPAQGQTDPLFREPGEYMVSARGRTFEQWEATKASNTPRIWSALYQGKPTPDAGDVFHRDWWMRFSTPIWTQGIDGSYFIPEATEVIQSWDMAFKDKNTSDFVVGQVWARKGAYVYLVDQVRARLSFTDTVEAVRRLSLRWPQSVAKLIEDTANGPAVISSLRKEVGGIIPVPVKGSKAARAAAVSPLVESNNVFLPTTAIAEYDVELFIEECTQFPNAAHDDQVDALSQALQRLLLRNSAAREWLEAMAPPCKACGQPNKPGTDTCVKCGTDIAQEPVIVEEPEEIWDPWQQASQSPLDNRTQATLDMLVEVGVRTERVGPFGAKW